MYMHIQYNIIYTKHYRYMYYNVKCVHISDAHSMITNIKSNMVRLHLKLCVLH